VHAHDAVLLQANTTSKQHRTWQRVQNSRIILRSLRTEAWTP